MKRNLDVDRYRNRHAIVGAGRECPLPNCFDGFFIQSVSKGPRNSDIVWAAIRADNYV